MPVRSMTIRRHGSILPWSGTRSAVVMMARNACRLGTGPENNLAGRDRRCDRKSNAAGLGFSMGHLLRKALLSAFTIVKWVYWGVRWPRT